MAETPDKDDRTEDPTQRSSTRRSSAATSPRARRSTPGSCSAASRSRCLVARGPVARDARARCAACSRTPTRFPRDGGRADGRAAVGALTALGGRAGDAAQLRDAARASPAALIQHRPLWSPRAPRRRSSAASRRWPAPSACSASEAVAQFLKGLLKTRDRRRGRLASCWAGTRPARSFATAGRRRAAAGDHGSATEAHGRRARHLRLHRDRRLSSTSASPGTSASDDASRSSRKSSRRPKATPRSRRKLRQIARRRALASA